MSTKRSAPIPLEEAIKDFSKVINIVDRQDFAIISTSGNHQYAVIDLRTYEELNAAYFKLMKDIGDAIISENLEALKELAK